MREELALSDRQEKCPACGYTIEDGEHRCEKCGRRLSVSRRVSAPELLSWPAASNREGPQPAQAGAVPEVVPRPPVKAPRRPAFPEPLRRQLSERVEEFRTRRLHPTLPLRLPLGHNEEPGAVHAVIPMRPLPNPSEQSREVPAGGGRPRRSRSSPVLQAALEFPSPSPRAGPLPRRASRAYFVERIERIAELPRRKPREARLLGHPPGQGLGEAKGATSPALACPCSHSRTHRSWSRDLAANAALVTGPASRNARLTGTASRTSEKPYSDSRRTRAPSFSKNSMSSPHRASMSRSACRLFG